MKPAIYYKSQLLYRRSYKPKRVIRIRPTTKLTLVFRPVHRFGMKPQLIAVAQPADFPRAGPEAMSQK